ncbi:ATP-grasp domain-containing protein [Ancylomarina longa]|uniref:ATP-grasp domain-containing protein n=1 Tax=Ancylomarina longa TaxID=2487017 RepID=A0A434ATW1_9BACT|nr:ATP-grasp domain-containing protein [Ancylomarina longa]RUT77870.1 ATP-grasp domain-containing protein [Ancylomarina longa]
MNQRKILLLGGSYFQVPSIIYAIQAGYYVITCDYIPENPGHQYADEYYNISTTDKELVLELARKLKVEGIVAYASDPAAPTAAYVAEKMNLPGNPYNSVKILAEKDLYRKFLSENGFNVPKAKGFDKLDDAYREIGNFHYPVMVKPVDSSGSKGVIKINSTVCLPSAFEYALNYSRAKRIVIEEFVEKKGPQIHGDAFVMNGKVIFCYLGDHHYNERVNYFVPYSTTLPSEHDNFVLQEIENEFQRLIELLQIKQGAFNIEARVNNNGDIFLMEVGPRNGGNLVPQLEKYASSFDMVQATVEVAMGNYEFETPIQKRGFYAYCVIHSDIDGVLKEIQFSKNIDKNIVEKHVFKNPGDMVISFQGSDATIGVLLLKFATRKEMINKIEGFENHIKVIVGDFEKVGNI